MTEALITSLTIFVLCRARRLYNPCTPFLVNISVADLCMTLFVLPLIGANALSGSVIIFYVCLTQRLLFNPNCLPKTSSLHFSQNPDLQ